MMRWIVSIRSLTCGVLLTATLACSGDGVSVVVGGLRFVGQPSAAVAGQEFTVTVELISGAGNRVTSATDLVTISVGGGATLSGTTSIAAVNGLATFPGISISRAGSNYQLSATSGAFTNAGTAFAVSAGAPSPTQSVVSLNPVTFTTAGSSTATFTFKDGFGNALGGVSVSLSSSLAGVTFTPSSGTTLADGTFSTSVSSTADGSASVTATVGGSAVTISTPIVIIAAPSALRFVTQPSALVAGQAFPVAVEFITPSGQRAVTASDPITLTANAGVAFAGIRTAIATLGVATFDGLTITTAGDGTQLTATGGGFTVNGTAFRVSAGPVSLAQSSLSFSTPLMFGTPSAGTFTLKDVFGNALGLEPVSVASSFAGTTFTPVAGTTSTGGVFASTITPGAVGPGTISVTTSTDPAVFPVTVGALGGVCNLLGPLTLGASAAGTVTLNNGCVLNRHSAAAYSLTVSDLGSSPVVALTGTGVSAGFFPEITITPEPPTSSYLYYPNTTHTVANGPREWLLPSGTFRASISSATGSDGAFSLLATSSVGAPGCSIRILLALNATYTGQSVSSTDCNDPSGPYYADLFALSDSRPCTITMRAAFDAFLEVDFVDGTYTSDDNSGGGTDAQITLPTCNYGGGPPQIVAWSKLPGVTGAYTLTLSFTGAGVKAAGGELSLPLTAPSTPRMFRRRQ